MPCESCAVQFSVFKRKRACSECERYYCSACLRRGGGTMCAPCRCLSTRPLCRQAIAHLKVRDIQCFLHRQNVSTRGCVEKEELLTLCISHVNGPSYRRRGTRGAPSGATAGAFTSLKGFTNNINNFINSAFDRPVPQPPPNGGCYNSSHAHTAASRTSPPRERFTTTPGGERDITVPVPEPESPSPTSSATPLDTADCFEVEDLPDGWEFVRTPAEPLPHDSEVLMAEADINSTNTRDSGARNSSVRDEVNTIELETDRPTRAASHLELRASPPAPEIDADAASLQDEPYVCDTQQEAPKHITLEQFGDISDLDALTVRQLKELLARNRVEYRGCVERAELLQRARNLYREHARYRGQIDDLPLEECCKICMSAPLECVLLECGHLAACTRCAARLAECPFCRQYVVRALRVFRS